MKTSLFIISIALTIMGCGPGKNAIIEPKPDVPKDVELTHDEPRDSTTVMDINISERNDMQDIGDPYTILDAKIIGDELWLNVSYGGGCKEHFFEMLFNNAYEEIEENNEFGDVLIISGIDLTLKHNGNEDHCRSIVTQNLRFNLITIQDKGASKLSIHLKGWKKSLTYNFQQ